MKEVSKEEYNRLSEIIIGGAIAVHRELGPGLLESAYEACLQFELLDRGLRVERQKEQAIIYRGIKIDCGYKIDLLVEDLIILELKAVEKFHPIYEAQLMSYLKLSGCRLGLLMNFNVRVLKDGIKRLVLNFPD